MDKPTKRDTAFCERDALADMRQAEREVLRAYAAAAAEGGSGRDAKSASVTRRPFLIT